MDILLVPRHSFSLGSILLARVDLENMITLGLFFFFFGGGGGGGIQFDSPFGTSHCQV